jgi:hypothetical protein
LKHKSWLGEVQEAWGGPITDPDEVNTHLTDDNNPVCQQWCILMFHELTNMVDPASLEMLSADVTRLRLIRQECEALQLEEQDTLDAEPVQQDPWMQYAAMAAGHGDAVLSDVQIPPLDTTISRQI